MDEKLRLMKSLREQMIGLRNDNSLLTGVIFTTLAGDIHITKKEIAVFLIDSMIQYLKEEISYNER